MKIKLFFKWFINQLAAIFNKEDNSQKELDDINDRLESALRKEEFKRALLKRKVNKFVRRYHNYSKYVPGRKFNKVELHNSISEKYGDEMKDLSLYITKDLVWK